MVHGVNTAGGVLLAMDEADTVLVANITLAKLQAHPEDSISSEGILAQEAAAKMKIGQ